MLPTGLARIGNRLGLLALVAATGVALFGHGSRSESDHPAWGRHVEPLAAHVQASGTDAVRQVTRAGRATFTSAVTAGSLLAPETADLAARLAAGDRDGAVAMFADLQDVPDAPAADIDLRPPSLSPGMAADLAAGEADLYRVYLYDSCAEDGDVVELVIDGASFAIVPITHQGATLTVPLTRGRTSTVMLRGIRDGGGGITVAFRTSDGDFFTRAMAEGELQSVALVGR